MVHRIISQNNHEWISSRKNRKHYGKKIVRMNRISTAPNDFIGWTFCDECSKWNKHLSMTFALSLSNQQKLNMIFPKFHS